MPYYFVELKVLDISKTLSYRDKVDAKHNPLLQCISQFLLVHPLTWFQ